MNFYVGSSENEKDMTLHSEDDVKVPNELLKSKNRIDYFYESTCDKNVSNTVDNFEPVNSDFKISVEANFKSYDPLDVNSKSFPKIMGRLDHKLSASKREFSAAKFSASTSLVTAGRRSNGSLKTDDSEKCSAERVVDIMHRKKLRRAKAQIFLQKLKQKVPDINQNFKSESQSYLSPESSRDENIIFQMDKNTSDLTTDNSKACSYSTEAVKTINCHLSDNSLSYPGALPSPLDLDFFSYHSKNDVNNISNDAADLSKGNLANDKENEPSTTIDDVDPSLFDFEDGNILPMSSSLDNPKQLNVSKNDVSKQFEISVDDGNIAELKKSSVEDMKSMNVVGSSQEDCFSSIIDKKKDSTFVRKEATNEVHNEFSNKDRFAFELIDELHAHNQKLFQEIEVSTPELELSKSKTSIQIEHPVISHQMKHCANTNISVKNVFVTERVENYMNSQNHLPIIEDSFTLSNKTVFAPDSATHNGTTRLRNVSGSSSSTTSKSSTSHRCYKKGKSKWSSSSNTSSDEEIFCNRPAKYDPVTDTFCDEFGREIRQSHQEYYRNSKSHQDSHSNNGSSNRSLSRSKSCRHLSNQQKHHESRSNVKPCKKLQHTLSHSRCLSHKDDDRKYRSPSPKHRSRKPHFYMDQAENMKACEEKQIMFVGGIPYGYTTEQLIKRFSCFGPIQEAKIKFKTAPDLSMYIFGFVTFKNTSDTSNAIENGNNDPLWPKFELNFGKRRPSCNRGYTYLDCDIAEAESGWYFPQHQPIKKDDDFEELLKQEQRRLGMSP